MMFLYFAWATVIWIVTKNQPVCITDKIVQNECDTKKLKYVCVWGGCRWKIIMDKRIIKTNHTRDDKFIKVWQFLLLLTLIQTVSDKNEQYSFSISPSHLKKKRKSFFTFHQCSILFKIRINICV